MYYTQVIGMPAPLVGQALTVALVLDAISDPVVGQFSIEVGPPASLHVRFRDSGCGVVRPALDAAA